MVWYEMPESPSAEPDICFSSSGIAPPSQQLHATLLDTCSESLSIKKAEKPQRNLVSYANLDTIIYDIAIRNILNL